MVELILGGVRSGKSSLAEKRAEDSGLQVVYVATAEALDEEMRQRIEHHRSRRPKEWALIEVGEDLAKILKLESRQDRCMLVDCLTLWMTRMLCKGEDESMRIQIDALLDVLPDLSGRVILVSNETNMGIVPMGELSRRYCDEVGRLHQRLGKICDSVILTVAGLPLSVKGTI